MNDTIKFGVTTAIAAITITAGLVQFGSTYARSVQQPFLEAQTARCFAAAESTARLATSVDTEIWKKAREEFWMLYWGPLAIVEDVEPDTDSQPVGENVEPNGGSAQVSGDVEPDAKSEKGGGDVGPEGSADGRRKAGVENVGEVHIAMVAFGNELDKATQIPPALPLLHLTEKSIAVAHACRDLLISRWRVGITAFFHN